MIATVVLAAGRSERFGSPKLLAEWWGRPLVERALEIAPPGLKVAVISTPTAKLLPLFQAHGFQCGSTAMCPPLQRRLQRAACAASVSEEGGRGEPRSRCRCGHVPGGCEAQTFAYLANPRQD